MLHPAEEIELIRAKRSYPLLDEESAIAVEGGERSAEVVDRPREEIGSGLIILLELQIGVEQRFKKIVPIIVTRAPIRRDALLDRCNVPPQGMFHKGSQSRQLNRLQHNTRALRAQGLAKSV
jgi:hypothetical protein